jgi:hypothetical protein
MAARIDMNMNKVVFTKGGFNDSGVNSLVEGNQRLCYDYRQTSP